MERVWACISDGVIVNTIVAGDDFIPLIAHQFDDVVEVTDVSPLPGVRWTVHADGYRSPQPHPSWLWQGGDWVAPTPVPSGDGPWWWDENAQEWIDTTPPTE